ncbi:MAG: MarR family transcriptional regulator [Thermomicrobiales bacterium]
MSAAGRDRLDHREQREQHVGRLLLRASRAFNARAAEMLRARGYARLSLAHLGLLPHLDAGGTRVTTLAERAGMTKQGMGQLVADLEQQGLVDRTPDPADRRATLVRFTPAGEQFLADSVAVTAELEAAYAARLGPEQFAALRAALAALVDAAPPLA